MIISNEPITDEKIAAHYDELDEIYRDVWGTHLHHGLWEAKGETQKKATENLSNLVLNHIYPIKDQNLIDVGCGYGETARLAVIAGASKVTGFTLSQKQYAYACKTSDPQKTEYQLKNWLKNNLPSECADGVYSIECFSHIDDKALFFQEIQRVLKPNGRFVLTAWLTADRPIRKLEKNFLLEPICQDSHLPSMMSSNEIKQLITRSRLLLEGYEDLSRKVERTWSLSIKRALIEIFKQRRFRTYLLDPTKKERRFVLTLIRIWLAYKVNAFRYGVFWGKRY